MKIKSLLMMLCVFILALGTTVMAQDEGTDNTYSQYNVDTISGTDPSAQEIEGMVVNATLEEVTANSEQYYGQIVTIEGNVNDFINARLFALGENATLDNDQVLVANNAARSLPPQVMQNARIAVTGRIIPSLVAVEEGAQTDFGSLFTEEGNGTDMMASDETDFNYTSDALNTAGYGDTQGDASLGEVDRNLENFDETQRTQIADALDQDASEWESRDAETSQYLRDAATGLRNNDVQAARTSLQQGIQRYQQGQGTMDPTHNTDTNVMSRPNMVQWAHNGLIPDGYDNFTILEVVNIDNVSFVEFGEGAVNN